MYFTFIKIDFLEVFDIDPVQLLLLCYTIFLDLSCSASRSHTSFKERPHYDGESVLIGIKVMQNFLNNCIECRLGNYFLKNYCQHWNNSDRKNFVQKFPKFLGN